MIGPVQKFWFVLHSLVVAVVVVVVVVIVVIVVIVVVDVPTLLTESVCVARELFSSTTQWILQSRLRMSRDELFEGGTERERGRERKELKTARCFALLACVVSYAEMRENDTNGLTLFCTSPYREQITETNDGGRSSSRRELL